MRLLVAAREEPRELAVREDRPRLLRGPGELGLSGESHSELVRNTVALGVAVEESHQEGPARAPDLRDQDERLVDRDEVLGPRPNDRPVLVDGGIVLDVGYGRLLFR